MKHFTFLLLSFIILWACNNNLNGEGAVQEKELILDQAPKKITLDGNFEIVWVQEAQHKVVLEAQENLLNNILIEENLESISISEKNNAKTDEIYKVYLHSDQLEEIELNGNVILDISGEVKSNEFSIELNDNAKLAAQIFIESLHINADDNSEIILKGNCSELEANLEGNSKLPSPEFIVSEAEIDLSENAQAHFQIIKKLSGKSNDNAVLEYEGNPNKSFLANDQSKIINLE